MTQGPELLVGHGKNGNPVSAACSFCGEWMPEDYASDAQGPEIVNRFVEHFKAHVREKHGPRFLNYGPG
jgi:hypothetical protein